MAFFDVFKQFFPPQQKKFNSALFSFWSPQAMPKMKEKDFLNAYMGWVYACTNAIAERLADIDLHLQVKNKDLTWQNVEQHDCLTLLHTVNPFMSYSELLYATQAFLELNGNTFWYVPNNGRGTPAEIWVLNPVRMSIVKSKTEVVSGYVYQTEKGDRVPLEPQEIIHFKKFNPNDSFRGMGTVQAAAFPIDIDTYAAEWQRNFFGNAAMPAAILQSDQSLTQDQYDRIRANWDSRYKGVQNAHKLAITEGGLKYIPMSPTSREMQFTEGRKNLRDEVLAIFRTPKPILGILEDVNLASAEQAQVLYAENRVRPSYKFFVEQLDEYLFPLFQLDKLKYRFAFTDPVPENRDEKRKDRESGLTLGYITINEARADIGKASIEGGDVLLIPSNMIPLDMAGQVVNALPQPKKEDDKDNEDEGEEENKPQGNNGKDDEGGDDDGNDDDNEGKGVKKNFTKKALTPEQEEEEKKYKAKQIAKWEKKFIGLNDDLKKQILANLEKAKSTPTDSTIQKLYKQVLKANAHELVKLLFSNYEDWIGLVYDATYAGLKSILAHSGKVALTQVEVDAEFDLENPRAVNWLDQYAREDSNSYSATMKEDIMTVIQQGVDNGDSVDTIADNLGGFFDGQDWRAQRYARTETIASYNYGSLEGYKQSGVVSQKEWQADDEACDECIDNEDDGAIDLDDVFSGGADCPPQHPNSYSKDTEVLTKRGWILVKDAIVGDQTLSVNPETSELCYIPVIQTFAHKERVLVHFNGNLIDLAVTPDHDMYYSPDGQKFGMTKAVDLLAKKRKGIFLTYNFETNEFINLPLAEMNIYEEKYNDMVYCVGLEKYHILFVRRNGKMVISGNCECVLIPHVNENA